MAVLDFVLDASGRIDLYCLHMWRDAAAFGEVLVIISFMTCYGIV